VNFRAKPKIPTSPVPAPQNVNVAGQMTSRIQSFNKPQQQPVIQPQVAASPMQPQTINQMQALQRPMQASPMQPQDKQAAIQRALQQRKAV
jgi:hypothetical protein